MNSLCRGIHCELSFQIVVLMPPASKCWYLYFTVHLTLDKKLFTSHKDKEVKQITQNKLLESLGPLVNHPKPLSHANPVDNHKLSFSSVVILK